MRESLLALKVDDLDLAMDSFRLAAGRQENHPKVAILREILTSEINFRRKKLLERIETPNLSPTQREALQQGVEILDRFLEGVRSPKGMLPGAGVRRTARDATDVEEVAFEPVGGAQAPIEAESETIVEEPTDDSIDHAG